MEGLARRYIVAATQFWHASRVATEAEPRELALFYPVGHSLGMSCELALKAFLLDRRISPRKLRQKFGHDLTALLKRAIREGLELTRTEAHAVVVLNATHEDHFFRYGWVGDAGPITGIRAVPDLLLCGSEIGKLIDRIAGEDRILRKDFDKVGFVWPAPPAVTTAVALSDIDAIVKGIVDGEQNARDLAAKGEAKFYFPPGQV